MDYERKTFLSIIDMSVNRTFSCQIDMCISKSLVHKYRYFFFYSIYMKNRFDISKYTFTFSIEFILVIQIQFTYQ